MKQLLTILFLAFHLFCFAQTTINIQEVLIEAEAEKDAIGQQKESGVSKIVISAKSLNNFGHHSAGDVLKRFPMMMMQGPPSFNRNVMMAGLDKQFQSILINGERPAGGEDYRDLKLDRIPIDMIQNMEIIYNPPASLGADATIGSINTILKDAPDKKFISSDLSFDYTSTHPGINPEFTVSLGNRWDKWAAMGSYSLNNFKRTNLNAISDGEIHGTEREELNVWIHGFSGMVSYKPDSIQTCKYQTFFSVYSEELDFLSDIKRRTKGGLDIAADTADDDKLRILHTHNLSYRIHKNGWDWNNSLDISQNIDTKDRWRWRSADSGTEESFEDENQVNTELIAKSEIKHPFEWGNFKNKLTGGMRFSALNRNYQRMVYTKTADHLFWDDIEDGSYLLKEYRASVYLSSEMTAGNWWIHPAIRFDDDWGIYDTYLGKGSIQYTSINPSLHSKYRVSPNFFIKGDIARQVSRPPFNLMVPVDKIKNKKETIERGNPELVPSTAWNLGLGLEKYVETQGFISFRGFYSRLRNVIETHEVGIDDVYGYRILQAVNVDSGLVWGMDVDSRLNLSDWGATGWAVSANVSWMGSQVRDPGTLELRRLNGQPVWTVNSSIDYLNTRRNFQISMGMNYLGERITAATVSDGSTIDALTEKPFLQFDSRIKYFFAPWGSIYLNALNLFNQTIEIRQGSVSESEIIGRNFVVGVSAYF